MKKVYTIFLILFSLTVFAQTITQNSLSNLPTCPTENFSINFSTSGVFNSNNQFVIQYSEDLAFTDRVNLNYIDVSAVGTYNLSGDLPGNATVGTRYVRVLGTSPVTTPAFSYIINIR